MAKKEKKKSKKVNFVGANAAMIEQTLEAFGIPVRVVEVNIYPAYYRFFLEVALGSKISRIKSLEKDIALALASPTGNIIFEAPVPGRALIAIWLPRTNKDIVVRTVTKWMIYTSRFFYYISGIIYSWADKLNMEPNIKDKNKYKGFEETNNNELL